MLAWFQLIRVKNLVLISISQVFIICFLYTPNQLPIAVIFYILCTFCLAAAGNIINDYFDYLNSLGDFTQARRRLSTEILVKRFL